MNGRKRVIAKGMTVLMLMTFLVLAGCGGSQPATDESASVKKVDSNLREDKFNRDGSGNASESKDEKEMQSAASESQSGEKSTATSTGKSNDSMAAAAAASNVEIGGRIEIRKAWVRIRSAPSNEAAPIGVAYGNDAFDVLDKDGDWFQVRLNKNQEGWVSVSATLE